MSDLSAKSLSELALSDNNSKLELQERIFDTVLSSIVDFAYTFDREGRFTYINQALLDLWQMKLADALGKNFFELNYPKELAARLQNQIESVFVSGQILRDETPYTGAAGTTGYYEYIFVPVFSNEGHVELVAGSTRDITERKDMERALHASVQQSRDILESITDAFVALDSDWRFTYVNRQAELMLDRAPGDLLGKVIWDVYTGLIGSEFELPYRRAASDGISSSVTAYYPDHDRWYEAHVYPAAHGITIYFRNITMQKQAEQERERHLRDIHTLNSRLKRAMTETHHRVKYNLQVISAMIEMQVFEHKSEHTIPLDEFTKLRSHIHTLSIVHDLLTTSVKESEDLQRISAKTVLEKLLPMLQFTAGKQNLKYEIDEAELTSKQCTSLALVLNELVTNALKYGKSDVCIQLVNGGRYAVLTVCDEGVGFPADFDPQFGRGSGLEIVESLVRVDLEGNIKFSNRVRNDNQPGGGVVTVTLPIPSVNDQN